MASKDKSQRTYLGFAENFHAAAGEKAIHPGEKVSLTEDQYRALTAQGHSFDPAWTEPTLPTPQEVPDQGAQETTIPALP